MDEHAARVTQRLREVWTEFQGGRASLGDLSRVASQTAMTLDNAHAELIRLLRAADGELEHAQYAMDRDDHAAEGLRIFGPIIAAVAGE